MAFDFEKLLNDSMIRIYDKYKDIDDSLDDIIDINLSEESCCTSSTEIYGDSDENFTFLKSRKSEFKTKRNLIRSLNFDTLYDFIFTVDSIDEIVEVIEILEEL
jgi:hypothetical protein